MFLIWKRRIFILEISYTFSAIWNRLMELTDVNQFSMIIILNWKFDGSLPPTRLDFLKDNFCNKMKILHKSGDSGMMVRVFAFLFANSTWKLVLFVSFVTRLSTQHLRFGARVSGGKPGICSNKWKWKGALDYFKNAQMISHVQSGKTISTIPTAQLTDMLNQLEASLLFFLFFSSLR